MSTSSTPQPIKPWGKFDFTKIDDASYVSTLDNIRARYQKFGTTEFREVPPVYPEGHVKTPEDYFTIIFVTKGGEISGLYERRGVYMFGIRVDKKPAPQPYEILCGMDFTLPNVDFKEVGCGVDYKSLGDPGEASYTLADLANAVTVLARGFEKAGSQWGRSLTTLIGATSEACKSIAMERHVAVGLNIITKSVVHAPSNRVVRIMKSWSKISKSIRTGRYNYVLNYTNDNGIQMTERVTEYSAGQILALINTKDGSKEEKQTRKQGKKDKGKRKREDFEESGEEGSTKRNRKKLNKTQKGSQFKSGSGSAGGYKYRGMAGAMLSQWNEVAKDIHVALNIDHDEQKSALLEKVEPNAHKIEERRQKYDGLHQDREDIKAESERQSCKAGAWVEDKEPEEIHKAAESEDDTSDFDFTDLTYDEYLEKSNKKDPPFDYSKAPEPFPVRMIPRGVYTSSDSDSDSDSESEQVQKVNSPNHMEQAPDEDSSDFDFTDLTYDKYLEKSNKKDPPFDYSEAPEPFPVRMIPRGVYTSSDSESDSESEDKSDFQNENAPKDTVKFQSSAVSEDDKTPAEPKKESPRLDFPSSSILVKHGMERLAEAGAGDKDSKGAREMASQTSDEENKGGGSTVFL